MTIDNRSSLLHRPFNPRPTQGPLAGKVGVGAAAKAPVKTAAAKAKVAQANVGSSFTPAKANGKAHTAQNTPGGFFQSLKDAKKTVKDAIGVGKSVKKVVDAVKGNAPRVPLAEAATKAAHKSGVGLMNQIKPLQGLVKGIQGVKKGVDQIREGVKNGDGHQVAGGVLTTARGAVNTVKEGLNTAAMVESTRNVRALNKAVSQSMGAATKLEKGIAKAAANAAHNAKVGQQFAKTAEDVAKFAQEGKLGRSQVLAEAAKSTGLRGKLGTTLKMGAANVLNKVPFGKGANAATQLTKSVEKAGALALGGTKGVAKTLDVAADASKVAGSLAKGAGPLAKAAGRFAPGANVAIAALDVGTAIKTISDPKASVADKVTSGITALGSVAAATNIPIVSQVGAAVSIASTAVGAAIKNFDSIKEGAKKVGSAIADGAKKIFSGW